jgi:hypothetical protein
MQEIPDFLDILQKLIIKKHSAAKRLNDFAAEREISCWGRLRENHLN